MFQEPPPRQKTKVRFGSGSGHVLAARTSIYLWEFLLEILEDPSCSKIVNWTDKKVGEFQLLNPAEVARQWGIVKRRPKMDKIKMCRAMRYYYKKGLIEKVKGRHYVYKFIQLPYNHPTLTLSPPKTDVKEPSDTAVWNVDEDRWETE